MQWKARLVFYFCFVRDDTGSRGAQSSKKNSSAAFSSAQDSLPFFLLHSPCTFAPPINHSSPLLSPLHSSILAQRFRSVGLRLTHPLLLSLSFFLSLSLFLFLLHLEVPSLDRQEVDIMTSHQLLSVVPGSTVVPIAQRLQDNKYQLHSTFNPNRHSLPSAHALYHNQHALLQSQKARLQQLPIPLHQKQQQQFEEKPLTNPSRATGPRLSLDTSDERLQNVTVIKQGNRRYLKLFSPGLVESPQSFLNQKQQVEDKKLWENGPNVAFQKQLEVEKREAYKGKEETALRATGNHIHSVCFVGQPFPQSKDASSPVSVQPFLLWLFQSPLSSSCSRVKGV